MAEWTDCEWVRAQLVGAWPSVRRISVRARCETRRPGEIGADYYAQLLFIDVSLTATADELLALRLTTPDLLAAIPASGSRSWGGYHLRRSRSAVRLNCFLHEPEDDARPTDAKHVRIGRPAVQLVRDAMALAVAPALWSPPSRRASAE